MTTTVQEEVDRNYEVFKAMLPSIAPSHTDQFALMKDGKVLGYFSSAWDARTAGEAFVEDKLYSIQQVTDRPVDLGYFSHAVHRWAL